MQAVDNFYITDPQMKITPISFSLFCSKSTFNSLLAEKITNFVKVHVKVEKQKKKKENPHISNLKDQAISILVIRR